MAELSPFDFLNSFWNEKTYSNYSNYDKSKQYFLLNRFCSAPFPLMGAFLSRIKISSSCVMDYWQYLIPKKFAGFVWGSPWGNSIRTKAAKEVKAKKDYYPSSQAIQKYSKVYKCTLKDIEYALKRYPEDMEKELKKIDEIF
jgi:hypothetical protein